MGCFNALFCYIKCINAGSKQRVILEKGERKVGSETEREGENWKYNSCVFKNCSPLNSGDTSEAEYKNIQTCRFNHVYISIPLRLLLIGRHMWICRIYDSLSTYFTNICSGPFEVLKLSYITKTVQKDITTETGKNKAYTPALSCNKNN